MQEAAAVQEVACSPLPAICALILIGILAAPKLYELGYVIVIGTLCLCSARFEDWYEDETRGDIPSRW
ncbi:hypothetical protein ACFL2D_00115 [Patescibacteria group bacterium]